MFTNFVGPTGKFMLDDNMDREAGYFIVGMNEQANAWKVIRGIFFSRDVNGNMVKVCLVVVFFLHTS